MASFVMARKAVVLLSLIISVLTIGCGKSVPKTDPKDDQIWVERIEKAIQAGEDLNQLEYVNGWKILSIVCAKGNIRSLQLLIDHGVDLKSKEGLLALDRCFASDRLDSAKILIQNGVLVGQEEHYNDILCGAILLSNQYRREFISLLVEAGISDVDCQVKDRSPALQMAAYKKRLDVVELLIQYGADVNARSINGQKTALHVCAQYGSPDVAELLIQHGADVNIKDESGRTPLTVALEQADPDHESVWGKRKVAKILKKYGGTK